MLWIVGGALATTVWLYLLFCRGAFWVFREPESLPIQPRSQPVCAVIPARNEVESAPHCIRSLCKQEYAGRFRAILVDDSSEDGTAEAVRGAADAEVVSVIAGEPLPDGWTGKLWAVAQGVRHASQESPEYLLLTDADIVHSPANVAQLVERAEAGGYDLVSYMATLECRSWAERAWIPAFVFFFFMLYPPAWIASPRRRTAGAAGGCMLIRSGTLERIGGIEAIRGELIDDCALAAAVKRADGSVWLGLSRGTRSLRHYGSIGEIERMISRTAFTQLRYSTLLLLGIVLALSVVFLLPVGLVIAGTGAGRLLGATAWVLMSAAYAPALRYYRRSLLWAPALPLVAAFYMWATVHSAIRYWLGKGGMWKGRAQAKPD